MADNRQELIRKIVTERTIQNQRQLMEALEKYGVQCTQATVSREIKRMNIVKRIGPAGQYHYAIADTEDAQIRQKLHTILRESIVSVDCAQNLIVIKTLPELASAACAVLDEMHGDGLVGTIAGDNTAFLAMRDNASAQSFSRVIKKLIDKG